MPKYTVILLRPEYADHDSCDEKQDIYICHNEADGVFTSVVLAQQEVFSEDLKEGVVSCGGHNATDYLLIATFPGHIEPTLCGWQIPK